MSSQKFSESDWEMLLAFIQEGGVIPVVGEGLSEIRCARTGSIMLFQQWLARELSKRLELSPCLTLDSLVQELVAAGGNLRSLYPLIKNLVIQAPFEPSRALRQLAEISDFPFYVTTVFDGLLAKALAGCHGGIAPLELSFSPKQFDDLPGPPSLLQTPLVYYLLGKVAATARYAICDEDVLEWISVLQSDTYAPERLVAELQYHHLLVLGVNYPDWLGRFFVRTAKRRRLSEDREWFEFVVHPEASSDKSLAHFLRNVSRNTFVIGNCADPSEFIDELHSRWTAGGSPPAPNMAGTSPIRFLPPAREMPRDAIFISYSRNDLDAVKRLKSGLDEHGFNLWFDLEQLATGDDYHDKIHRNILNCSYFVPVISTAALARDEAFFYREWDWAIERRRGMGPGAIFVLPVIVDDTPAEHPRITGFASTCDIARLPGGFPDERFVGRLAELIQPNHV